MKPVPNTLNIKWILDGNEIASDVDSVLVDQDPLAIGNHTLTVTVTDTTSLLRVDNHAAIHFSTVTWTINKSDNGVALTAADNKISCSVYPNPAGNILNVRVDLEKRDDVDIELISADGKPIRQIVHKALNKGINESKADISSLTAGTYVVVFNIGGMMHSKIFIKE